MAILALDHWPKASLSGRLDAFALFLHAQEHGRLVELQPDPDGNDEKDQREQERDAPSPLGERGFAHEGADAEDQQQRHEQSERGGGLDPGGVVAALAWRRVLGDVDRRAAVLAAQCQALHQAKPDQHHGCQDAPLRVGGQDADEEGPHAHQRHGDQEGIFPADDVADASEQQRAERAHGETGGEGEQREDEADIGRDVGEEVLGEKHAQRAVDVEIIPLEHGPQRRCEDDQPFFRRHPPRGHGLVHCHGCHWSKPPRSFLCESRADRSRYP